MHGCNNSSVLAMESLQSCAKSSIYKIVVFNVWTILLGVNGLIDTLTETKIPSL